MSIQYTVRSTGYVVRYKCDVVSLLYEWGYIPYCLMRPLDVMDALSSTIRP